MAILIHSLLDFNMLIHANAILAVTLMALLSGYLRFATERYWWTARLGTKLLLTITLVAGSAYLGSQAVRSGGESVWLIRAHAAQASSPEQIEALQKAFAFEPRNPDMARAIGEAFRLESWQNGDDYEAQALEAIKWFKRATELNPYDDSSFLRYGMCLDHIDRHDEAMTYFDRAVRIDPNSYFDNAYMGWHYAQAGNYAAARPWLERSYRLESRDNPVAVTYLQIAKEKMMEAATNTSPLHVGSPQSQTTLPPWDGK